MSITFVNGVGTAIKGLILQVTSETGGAKMPTIGPPNGTGKLYQPGTRGLVADDWKSAHPNLYLSSGNEMRYVQNPSRCGYAAVLYMTDSSLDIQGQTTYLDSSLYGMRTYMQSYLNSTVNGSFYLPCPITATGYDYDFDLSRYGNKPITGNYNTYNQAGVRGIHTPSNKTIYKWEAHVLASVWNWAGGANTALIAESWISRLIMIHIPVFTNNTWYRYSLTLEKTHIPTDTRKLCCYKYFIGEFSGNIPGNTFIASPVLQFDGSGGSANENRPTLNVQTKFCFKDD